MHYELHISSHPLPVAARIARDLRGDGIRTAELLDLAATWGNDLDRAWTECERLELIYPLAILRRSSRRVIVRGVRETVRAARRLLPRDLGWERVDQELALDLLDGAVAPDIDVVLLFNLRACVVDRLKLKGPGRHRQHLLRAASFVAELGMRGDSPIAGASAAAAIAVEHVLGALVDEDGGADLFSSRIDLEAFVAAELERARTTVEIA